MKLSDILSSEKLLKVEYPGMEGFEVTLAFLSKDSLLKIRKASTTLKINRKTRQPEEELDEDLFTSNYIKAVVKDWVGLKLKYVASLAPIEVPEDQGDQELEYSKENAEVLMKNSMEFDTWVTEMVGDLQNFTKSS